MAIPEHQIATWSNQGANKTSASTYENVKNCINGGNWNSEVGKNYLQGSYKNSTNIYGDSRTITIGFPIDEKFPKDFVSQNKYGFIRVKLIRIHAF